MASDVDKAVQQIIYQNEEGYKDLLYQLTTRQRNLLVAVSREGKASTKFTTNSCQNGSVNRKIYSWRMASMGSMLAAFCAGMYPKRMPMKTQTRKLT